MSGFISLFGFLILMLAGYAQAVTIVYVNNTTSCPGSGTSAVPYCTIQNAFNHAAPGQDIRIQNRGTTYNEADTLSTSGTSANPIVIESDNSANPPTLTNTVDVSNNSAQMTLNNVSYVTIRNLKWDGTDLNVAAFAIYVTNGSANLVGFNILNNTITNWGASNTTVDYNGHGNAAIEMSAYCNLGRSTTSIIRGNRITGSRYAAIEQFCPLNTQVLDNIIAGTVCGRADTGSLSAPGETGAEPLREDCGLDAAGPNVTTNTLYQGNEVGNTSGACSLTMQAGGWAGFYAGIHVDDGCAGGTFQQNKVHDIAAPSFATTVAGIHLEQHTAGWQVLNNLVYNLSGGNGARGIYISAQRWTAGTNAPFLVAGNTVYNDAYDAYVAQGEGTTFRNNIALNNGGAGYAWLHGSCTGCSFDYNSEWDTSGGIKFGRLSYSSSTIDFAAWKAANPAGTDAHSLNADPNLANPSAGDFRETSTSDTIGGGFTISRMAVDFAGFNRTGPPDIGAYNFAHPAVLPSVSRDNVNLAPINQQ
jgi:hypothetical protein